MKNNVMKTPQWNDTPFQVTFVFLVVTAIFLLLWQCGQLPPGPSRVGAPASAPAKP
jgi:hypothetical protein